MRRVSFGMVRAIALTLVMVSCACSQTQTLNIWPGVAPGSETWSQKERVIKDTPLGTVVFNVVTPTLTVYLPDPAKATGTGIIIAPGGAFVALAIDLEGHDVARWLQNKGIAASPMEFRPSRSSGSTPRNGAFPRTGSASWVSRPAPWWPAERCSSKMPPRVQTLWRRSTAGR